MNFLCSLLYVTFQEACPHIAKACRCLGGLCVLRQDPLECLISFICSSNNNIPRITLMLQRLRQRYGQKIEISAEASRFLQDEFILEEPDEFLESFYSFPNLQQLSLATETELRGLGFGYRAKVSFVS